MTAVLQFLKCATPSGWLHYAAHNILQLLSSHAKNEQKAAAAALKLLNHYGHQHPLILNAMPKIIIEEITHFKQVAKMMKTRHLEWAPPQKEYYANALYQHSKSMPEDALLKQLVIAAIIEARSCERFFALCPLLNDEALASYYHTLAQAESKHFLTYLHIAKKLFEPTLVDACADVLLEFEAQFITRPTPFFYFHSGPPQFDTT